MYDSVSSLVAPMPEIRLPFNKIMTAACEDHELTLKEAVLVKNRLNYMLDISLAESILAYEQYTAMNYKKNRKQLLELSAPIVPIQNGIAILPLVGTIDYDRAEHLNRSVISKISQMDIICLILDFSGFVKVNSEIAGYILNINNVLRLLGIEAIMTGLRPMFYCEMSGYRIIKHVLRRESQWLIPGQNCCLSRLG